MDMEITGKQNGLQLNRGDWAATQRQAQNDSQQGAQTSVAATGANPAQEAPKSYESPVLKVDAGTGAAVLSFRNPGSDEQSFQIPSRTALEYERHQRMAQDSPNPLQAKPKSA